MPESCTEDANSFEFMGENTTVRVSLSLESRTFGQRSRCRLQFSEVKLTFFSRPAGNTESFGDRVIFIFNLDFNRRLLTMAGAVEAAESVPGFSFGFAPGVKCTVGHDNSDFVFDVIVNNFVNGVIVFELYVAVVVKNDIVTFTEITFKDLGQFIFTGFYSVIFG